MKKKHTYLLSSMTKVEFQTQFAGPYSCSGYSFAKTQLHKHQWRLGCLTTRFKKFPLCSAFNYVPLPLLDTTQPSNTLKSVGPCSFNSARRHSHEKLSRATKHLYRKQELVLATHIILSSSPMSFGRISTAKI